MSAGVREQLDRLAQGAPTGVPPSDLWQRGVRRRRRRLAAGVAASVLAVLVGGLGTGLAWDTARPTQSVAPAATEGEAIPTRVEKPSPWLPDDTKEGPVGPVAVLLGAERSRWLGFSSNGVLAVSARTGTYRFLDLPDRMGDGDGLGVDGSVELSPGGRRVAYWLKGTVATSSGGSVPGVVGVASYDTVTGKVRRLPLGGRLGADPQGLTWLDDDRLLVAAGRVLERRSDTLSSRSFPSRVWWPARGRTTPVPGGGLQLAFGTAASPSGGLVRVDGTGLFVRDRSLEVTGRYRLSGVQPTWSVERALLGPGGRMVAMVERDDSTDRRRLLVGRVPAGATGTVRLREVPVDLTVPGSTGPVNPPTEVLGWRDRTRVVVAGFRGNHRFVDTVDVRTASARRIVDLEGENLSPSAVFATALWSRDTVARPGPPGVLDPRLAALAGAAVVLLAVRVVVRRRRRGVA